jgi:anti-sigma regulatory factor (Ser/Thr protein kinase)
MNELIIEAKMENTEKVQDFVSARIADCSAKVQNQIGIAVDEIFSNIARYAYHPETGGAVVRIAVDDDITLMFEDSGEAFDPLSLADPDITVPAEEREIGGLGLYMVKNLMDSAEYRRSGNKNILTIKKRLAQE